MVMEECLAWALHGPLHGPLHGTSYTLTFDSAIPTCDVLFWQLRISAAMHIGSYAYRQLRNTPHGSAHT